MKKIVISWILSVLGILALLVWAGHGASVTTRDGDGTGTALVHGAFSLSAADGAVVTEKQFSGRYMLVYFGYTHCPDICPTTLLLMQNVLSHLGPLAEKIQPIFITIDPERDTPQVVGTYAKNFGKTIGLSGTAEQIRAAADHFKVFYSKVEDKGSALGYTMDHSGFIYLMGPDARYVAHFASTSSERELEEGIRRYVH